jgi:hypothetical protein
LAGVPCQIVWGRIRARFCGQWGGPVVRLVRGCAASAVEHQWVRCHQAPAWFWLEQPRRRGTVLLTRRFEDGSRSAVVLDLPWNPCCTSSVLELQPESRLRMEGQQLGLKEADGLSRDRCGGWDAGHLGRQRQAGDVPGVGADGLVAGASGFPCLVGGIGLGGNSGCRGRKLRIQDVAQLLRFSVVSLGAPDRWLPPDDLVPVVGPGGRNHASDCPRSLEIR